MSKFPMSKSVLRSLVCAVAILATNVPAYAALRLTDPLPVSPQVTVGKLPNGLTYYVRKNTRPEQKLELRLVVKAGSILEDDDQQGFAHFVEHMAFNGTTNFKKHQLVSYLESIGVRFGADLNAYTSFDETVYILPIPTTSPANVEQAFRVLRDWAGGISFVGQDIDQERPVVLEELRLGKGARDRMDKVLLPKMFNGSRYAQRLPIGQEAVIKNGSHDAMRRFYRDWYRPDLMAVVVVGDLDPAQAERLIKRHFADLTNPAKPRARFEASIAPTDATQALVITDKEAGGNQILIRYPVRPVKESDTVGGYRADLLQALFTTMLNQRMHALSQRADPPFLGASSAIGRLTARYEAYSASAALGKGGAAPAIAALVQEHTRASKFGFSAAELERTRKNLLRRFERTYVERDKTDSAALVGEFVRNFLHGESIPGIENEYQYARELIPGITLAEVNSYAREAIPLDSPKLVVYMGTAASDSPAPGRDELLAAVASAEKAQVKPRDEKALATSIMPVPPKAGTVVGETEDKRLGTTTLTLSNGVKVMLKPTNFKNDQVIIGASRFGGQSLASDADIVNARYASTVAGVTGVADYAPIDLTDMLAGKTASVSANLTNYTETVRGTSGSADIEAMLQLLHLKMTTVRRDPALFQSFVTKQAEASRSTMAQPEAVFEDALAATLYNNHPRVARVPRPEEFRKIDMDRALAFYQQRFGSASGMTFVMVGSFDMAAVKPLIATYIASLPAAPITTGFRDVGANAVRGVVTKEVRAGSEDKAVVSLNFTGDAVYSEQEQMRMNAMLEVMNIRIIEVLREKMALIYGGGMSGAIAKIPTPHYRVAASLPTSPANVDKVIAATMAEIERMKTQGPSQEDLNKVRKSALENHRNAMRENGYWMSRLQSSLLLGTDPASILDYEAQFNALTVDDLRQAARRYFDMKNYVQVVLKPEAAK